MMDDKVLAEVISRTMSKHLEKNGDTTQRNLWIRFFIQIVIVIIVVVSIYFALKYDVTTNAVNIKQNSTTIDAEVLRSIAVDETFRVGQVDMQLKVNTIRVKQDTVLTQQIEIGKDIDRLDGKVDELLKRVPK